MPVAPPAQYGIDCAIARRGNTRNSGNGYCQKGQYAVLGAAIACSNTPLFTPIAPPAQYGIDCAIARRSNTRNSGHGYCQKGQYAVLGAAIACSNTPLFAPIAPAGAIGLGLRYCPTGQYAQLGARLLPKRAIRRASVLHARAILGLRIACLCIFRSYIHDK